MMDRRAEEYVFWLLSLAAMAVYFFNRGWGAGHPLFVSKALSVLFLLCLAARYAEGRYDRFSRNIIIGLAFGVAGDIYLLSPGRSSHFLPGLICFLLGHVFYIIAFSDRRTPVRRGVILIEVLAGSALLAVLVPAVVAKTPGLAVPVVIYAVVILAMVYFGLTRGIPVLVGGVVLFAVSDSFLAYNRFAGAIPGAHIIIWSTYYAGQALIALSVKVREPAAEQGNS